MREYRVSYYNITEKMLNECRNELNISYGNPDRNQVTSFVRSNCIKVDSYTSLLSEIAELSYKNPDVMLFFRGQTKEHKNKKTFSLRPNIFRNESKLIGEKAINDIKDKYKNLEEYSRLLIDKILKYDNVNNKKLDRKEKEEIECIKVLQHSILQHYQVCPTPFLDVSQSIKVACTFATLNNDGNTGYVFVFALPYVTGRISVDSEDYITNVRLISIGSTYAKRPFFQEGFLIKREFADIDNVKIGDFDFNRRLVAAYSFKSDKSFWDSGENAVPKDKLFPENDIMKYICKEIEEEMENKKQKEEEVNG